MGWAGRSSKRGGGGGAEKDNSNNFSGCMSAVFQLFDFHHHQFNFGLHQQPPFRAASTSLLPEEPTAPKGIEAPRNSLDVEEDSSSTIVKEEETLKIPMGHIQIRTNGGTRSKANDSSSEISSSPGAKTPTLVARLMGLDLLPDCSSPTLINAPRNKVSSYPHRKSLDSSDVSGTRSLPETPRISSARRSDVDRHRFSLQLNKENNASEENIDVSRFSYLRRREVKIEDESRSSSPYARQIVKQVKESVGRKVWLDITNTVMDREQRRDQELLSQLKCKRNSKPSTKVVEESSPGKHSTQSCSPRLSRFLEPKTIKEHTLQTRKPSNLSSPKTNTELKPTKVTPRPKLQPVQEQQEHKQQQQQRLITLQKCNKESVERFGPSRLKKPPQTSDIIRNKQEEPFVCPSSATTRANVPADKKCRNTLLSNDLLNISIPALLPVKKDPSPPATKIPQKQVSNAAQESKRSSQLSSCLSQSYTLIPRGNDQKEDISNGAAATTTTSTSTIGNEAEYREYVTRILRHTGIDKDTAVSFTRWFSPSHPLDPSIFYFLEHFTAIPTKLGQLHHRCNRKLLFHLVDELLVQVLKPYITTKPCVASSVVVVGDYSNIRGSELIDTLCKKIGMFPRKDCRVLEDIDALIDEDLPQMKVQREIAFEEEGGGIVTAIEKDILDTLLHESAAELFVGV